MSATTTGTTAKGTATPRIVIVGAGGWVFPVELTRDILSFPALSGCTLVLYDIDIDAAAKTAKAAEQLIALGGLTAQVEIPADLPTALRGADFVLTVFQVGGVRAYAHDLLIPREYGIDQIVGDTLGPGGVFRGLRTIEALRVVAQTMLAECPGALLLNYTNPMAPNIWATDLLGVKVIGLCHSVQNTAELLCARTRRAAGGGDLRLRRGEPHRVVHHLPAGRART